MKDKKKIPSDDLSLIAIRECRICGCTDDDCTQCVEKTGKPCYWVQEDLCSACDRTKGGSGAIFP